MGFLGLLAFLTIIGFFIMISWLFLLSADAKKYLPLTIAFIALIVGQFVYHQNTVLDFSFWFVLGLAAVSWQKPISEKRFSFKDFPELSLVITTFLMLLLIGTGVLYYFGARVYLADMQYAKSQQLGSGPESTALLEKAVKIALNLGLFVNAGHGLNYSNIKKIISINGLRGFYIGHSIISRAIYVGIENAVREMKKLVG